MARAALFAATAGALAAPMLTQVRARLAGGWGAHASRPCKGTSRVGAGRAAGAAPRARGRRAQQRPRGGLDRAGGLGAPCTCQTCLAHARGGQGRRGLRRTKLAHQPKRPPGALRPPAPRPRSKPVLFSFLAPRWNPRAAAPLGAPPRGLPLARGFLCFVFGARGAWRARRLAPGAARPPARGVEEAAEVLNERLGGRAV